MPEEAIDFLVQLFFQSVDHRGVEALRWDGLVLDWVREVGCRVVEQLWGKRAEEVIAEERLRGFTLHKTGSIHLRTVLGTVRVPSPQMKDRRTGAFSRPVRRVLGVQGGMMTPSLERAATDFGAEESFQHAAKRLEEHYGVTVGRTSILRVVRRRAEQAERFVTERLQQVAEDFEQPLAQRPGADTVIVELDGSMVRTGVLEAIPSEANDDNEPSAATATATEHRRKRKEAWKEVRVGFARRDGEADRTYVARMDTYENIVQQLFAAAVDRGLSPRTKVFSVSDGGNGLMEELQVQFSNLQFLLDRAHLKQHLYTAAAAADAGSDASQDRQQVWVREVLSLIDAGDLDDVIEVAGTYERRGIDEMRRLAGYLTRFRDALDYTGAKEAGLPNGSGEIESAHRYIQQKRLKIPGACWHPDSVNPMLALRVLRANGWWDDFWRDTQPDARAA